MKITLITPIVPYKFENTPYTPLGIGYLVASIRKNCPFVTDIQFIDGQILPENEYWQKIEQVDTDVLLISATIRQMKMANKTASIIKSLNEDVFVILGGAGPSGFSKLPQMNNIDMVVKGEGEEILPLILESLDKNNQIVLPDGCTLYQEKEMVIVSVITPPDINNISQPDRTVFDNFAYRKRWIESSGINSMSVIGSRGCPFHCIFCDHSVTGYKIRYRDVKNIADEMIFLQNKYHPDDIFFYDDLFTINEKRVNSLCSLLKKGSTPITWSAQGRVDCVTEKMLEEMLSAGCTEVMFGVESGSDNILKYFRKGFTREQIIKAFDLCHKVGIKAGAYFIIGVPGETRNDILQTISLVERIKPSLLNISYLTPFPATELYKITKQWVMNENYESWDDFQTTVYNCSFEIRPEESEQLILDAYQKLIDQGMPYSDYQFANSKNKEVNNEL